MWLNLIWKYIENPYSTGTPLFNLSGYIGQLHISHLSILCIHIFNATTKLKLIYTVHFICNILQKKLVKTCRPQKKYILYVLGKINIIDPIKLAKEGKSHGFSVSPSNSTKNLVLHHWSLHARLAFLWKNCNLVISKYDKAGYTQASFTWQLSAVVQKLAC